jgi:hypothetical protein
MNLAQETAPAKKTGRVGRPYPLWLGLACVALTLLGLALGYREIASPDLGFHLNSGRWIAEQGEIPKAEPFIWPALGRPYYDMQWLFQLGAWHLYTLGGTLALVLTTTGLTLLGCLLTLFRSGWRNQGALLSGLFLTMLFFLGQEWEIRPHLISWLMLGVVFAVLEAVDRGHRRWVWVLPPVMIIWANCHSLYILGLVAIGCHGLGWFWRAANTARWSESYVPAAVAVLAALACFITPFGWDGLRFPFVQFGYIGSNSLFAGVISELRSPLAMAGYRVDGRWIPLAPTLFWQVSLALIGLGYLLNWRRVRIAEWVALALFGYIFIKANKSFGYFIIATLPVAAGGWSSWWKSRPSLKRTRPWLLAGVTGFAVLLTGWGLTGGWYKTLWSPHRVGHGWKTAVMPYGAGEVLARAPNSTKNLLSFDYGGYIAFAAKSPVFIDGRIEVYGPDHYRRYQRAKESKGALEELRAIQPDWVLVQHAITPGWHRYLAARPGWRRVYADEWCALYFWRDYAPAITAQTWADTATTLAAPPIDDPAVRVWLETASTQPEGWLMDVFVGSALYPVESLRLSAASLMIGEKTAARNWALRGLHEGKRFYPDMWVNAAYAFRASEEIEHALYCLSVLAQRGHRKLAEKIQREILVSG